MTQNLSRAAAVLLGLVFAQQAVAQTFEQKFGHVIDLNHLDNYASQPKPAYITKDNTAGNPITDIGATLGRILFHDKKLSVDGTVSCSSCHSQILAFADDAVTSQGMNGTTGRHSMRLINARFANEAKFFWNERAATLEQQTTQPIQDHAEMGFSGQNGDPGISQLITRLSAYPYYQELFTRAYGDAAITETRLQLALAQFVRSIQSFDSKYDAGRTNVPNDGAPFPNFSAQENQGKQLFLAPPQFNGPRRVGGGLGCAGCHQPPEFDIDPNSLNNGVVGIAGASGTDLTNRRSPTLRDIFQPVGSDLNGPLMHDGSFTSMEQVLAHYNSPPLNTQLDPRLARPGNTQMILNITPAERDAVVAFMRTLTGSSVYFDTKLSDPFETPPTLAIDECVVQDTSLTRSILTQIKVVFNRQVSLNASSFSLFNLTTNQAITSIVADSHFDDGRTFVTLTFASGPSVETRGTGNSLDDGEYEFRVHGDQIAVVGSSETMADDYVLNGAAEGMYRLFGDTDHDADVDTSDFALGFRGAYGSSIGNANFRTELDVNGDNRIDLLDFIAFRANYGLRF